jgi:hypothetical protein
VTLNFIGIYKLYHLPCFNIVDSTHDQINNVAYGFHFLHNSFMQEKEMAFEQKPLIKW